MMDPFLATSSARSTVEWGATGAVESANKRLVEARLKGAGA